MKAHIKKDTAVFEMKAHEVRELALIMDDINNALRNFEYYPRTDEVANLILGKYNGLFLQMYDCWKDGGEYETTDEEE